MRKNETFEQEANRKKAERELPDRLSKCCDKMAKLCNDVKELITDLEDRNEHRKGWRY